MGSQPLSKGTRLTTGLSSTMVWDEGGVTMRFMVALLVLTTWMAVAAGPAVAQDGPSVCHYNDGTLVNPGRWECPQPYWPGRN